MSAQVQFQSLLRDHVKPALAAHGYKRNAGNFTKRTVDGWCVINFQKGKYNTQDEVAFAINLGVSSDRLSRMYHQYPHPTIPPMEIECHWRGRIVKRRDGGFGLYNWNGVGDHWWELKGRTDFASLVQSVLDVLETIAIPELRLRDSDKSLFESLKTRKEFHLQPPEFVALLKEFGTHDELQEYVEKSLKEFARLPYLSTMKDLYSKLGVITPD